MEGTLVDWSSTDETALAEARALVADALAFQSEDIGEHPSLTSLDPAALAALREVAPVRAASGDTAPLVSVHASPLRSSLDVSAGWSRGLATTASGPFVRRSGAPVWVHHAASITFASFVAAPGASPFLMIEAPISAASSATHTLGRGTVWIRAAAIAPGAPDHGWLGIRIAGGAYRSAAPLHAVGGSWVVAPSTTLVLTIQPSDPGTAPTSDAI